MAKKNLTPEEVKAKIAKKEAKSKLFFGTFTKALAVFLALVVAYSLVSVAFTLPSMILGGGNAAVQGGNATTPDGGSSTPSDDDVLFDDQTPSDDATTPDGGDATTPDGGEGNAPAAATKADVAKLLNEVTAKAAKGDYKWARKCWYTSPLDVGSATDTLNGVIQRVDPNANLDSVVGGFLGISGKETDPAWEGDVKGGKLPSEGKMNDEKYLLKGFSLAEADIKAMQVKGNTYMVQLNACKSPQKDGGNALNHVTNDFITKDEVSKGVADGLGSLSNLVTINSLDVDFTAILVTAVVENNALKSVKISYTMTVNSLKLKALVANIDGKGAGKMECTYTFA
ncbi:MAG: hypothetical protein IKV25_07210 [Clostridia bacterium]|nr:hypothetical protein [Clostridia bacterium]